MPASGLFCPYCNLVKSCPFHKPSDRGLWSRTSSGVERVRILTRNKANETDNGGVRQKPSEATMTMPPMPVHIPSQLPPPAPNASLTIEDMHAPGRNDHKESMSV